MTQREIKITEGTVGRSDSLRIWVRILKKSKLGCVRGVFFPAHEDEGHEKEEHEENAEGGAKRLVAGAGELVLDHFPDGGGWNRRP